jgi:hypothetical protein
MILIIDEVDSRYVILDWKELTFGYNFKKKPMFLEILFKHLLAISLMLFSGVFEKICR